MSLLEVNNITHYFGDKLLYKNSSFEIYNGEHVGIVGKNGTGKTTLLNTLIGEIIPDSGSIKWQKNITIGYLDQYVNINNNLKILDYLKTSFENLYKLEQELNNIYDLMSQNFNDEIFEKSNKIQSELEKNSFYELESVILKVASGLGITAFGLDKKIGELSGGQKAKVILAKLLLQKPDVLLLDEPTNFLDKEHVDWLTEYLKKFKKTFLVISHDFDFLDKITNTIIDIEFNTIKKYTGNFSKFLNIKNIQRESYVREFKAQQKEIKKHEDFIAKNRVRASTAKQAQSRIKILNKMDKIDPPESEPRPNFVLKSLPISYQKALIIKNLEIGYTHKLLPKFNLEVLPDEKIVITGFNGIGKSTLLKTLVEELEPISGWFYFSENTKIGYFEQDLNWENPNLSPFELISDKFPKYSQSEIRKFLAQCGLKSKHVLRPISSLSGGEQAKVKICILMLTESNFLILDEPTNHLDFDSKEVLKTQLQNWHGGLILVSHEHEFYKNWCTKIINISKH